MPAPIHDVLARFRDEAASNRDLGERFEHLICRYLEPDPIDAEQLSRVWMFNEWPRKGSVGDVGMDLADERAIGGVRRLPCQFRRSGRGRLHR